MPRFEEMLGELLEMGTRSIRLSGGGEPLFHRRIGEFLAAIRTSGLPIENVTTNAVLLRAEIAELLAATCDHVTVSLNTADAATYGAMMQTNPANFQRAVDNVKALTALRRARRARHPKVLLQFLVWKGNYRQIPEMYRLAREIGVDRILFNGLAFLPPEKRMTPLETDEMMGLYEEVLRADETRLVGTIDSFEQDLSARVAEITHRLRTERARQPFPVRAARFLRQDGLSLPEKAGRLRERVRMRQAARAGQGLDSHCLIGWHSMVIRSTGVVAPCCILQEKALGNVYQQTVREVWHGEAYNRFRGELSRIMRSRRDWRHDPERDATVTPLCGPAGNCPVGSFYYTPDIPFLRAFNETVRDGSTS
jgi:MoaA/NifB/PqqE/SkfB family radical SAM enzyme